MRKVAQGKAPGEVWQRLPGKRFFTLFMNDVISNYYAHPKAWAEIGFNGPASPRGHMRGRLGLGKQDPWEARERKPRSSVEIVRRAEQAKQAQQGAGGGGETH